MSKRQELTRRLNVIWMLWTDNPCGSRQRYIPKAMPLRTSEGGWQVFDRKIGEFLSDAEVLKLSQQDCSEMLVN